MILAVAHCAGHFEFSLPDALLRYPGLELEPRIPSSAVLSPIDRMAILHQPLTDIGAIRSPAVSDPTLVAILILKSTGRRTRCCEKLIERIGGFLAASILLLVTTLAELRTFGRIDTAQANSRITDLNGVTIDDASATDLQLLCPDGGGGDDDQQDYQDLQLPPPHADLRFAKFDLNSGNFVPGF